MEYVADNRFKRTATHAASYKGHHGVLSELLKFIQDAWKSIDRNGHIVLHIAVMQS